MSNKLKKNCKKNVLVRLHTPIEMLGLTYASVKRHENATYGMYMPHLSIWEQIGCCMSACKEFEKISGDRYEYEMIGESRFAIRKFKE